MKAWAFALVLCTALTVMTAESSLSVYFVGDSVLDGGTNLVRHSKSICVYAPYGQTEGNATGRCSDGYLISDFVATALGLPHSTPYAAYKKVANQSSLPSSLSFASAGSRLLDKSSQESVPFEKQVFQAIKVIKTMSQEQLADTLFVVSTGTQDLITYYEYSIILKELAGGNLTSSCELVVNYMTVSFHDLMISLFNAGAQKVVILGVGPVGCSPVARKQKNNINGISTSDGSSSDSSSSNTTTSSTTSNTTDNTTGNTTGNTTSNTTGNTTDNTTGNTTDNTTGNTTSNTTGNTTGNTTSNTTGNTTSNTTGNPTSNTTDNTTQCDELLNWGAKLFNLKLQEFVNNTRFTRLPNLNVTYFDTYGAIKNLMKNAGFNNTSDACCPFCELGPDGWLYKPTDNVCTDPSTYLYWDLSDLTEHANQLLAEQMLNSSFMSPLSILDMVTPVEPGSAAPEGAPPSPAVEPSGPPPAVQPSPPPSGATADAGFFTPAAMLVASLVYFLI